MTICSEKDCTACGACINICPTNSIKFKKDIDGFNQISINEKTCIKCGKCLNICPATHNIQRREIIKSYAAVNKDNIILMSSSSGGVFTEIAKYVIKNNGCVFGAVFDENLKVMHTMIDNEEDIEKLKGSKYVQSDTNKTFQEAKKQLENGKMVLYSGTPCQIAGLKSVIGNKYEENLITIDLICHGVPSQSFFDEYLKYISKNKKITNFKFRHKIKNDKNCEILHYVKNKKNINIKNPMIDPYYYSFLHGYINRESCYHCKYANDKRVGDITLGDFWGAPNYYKEFKDVAGVSAVLINTEKGEKIFEIVKNKFEIREANIEDIKRHNKNLVEPSPKTEIRDNIFEQLRKNNFEYIAKKYCTPKNKNILKLKSYIPIRVKEKVKFAIKRK